MAVAVELQPEAFVTVTVYVVVVLGLTCVVDVVSPVLHRYDPPPVAANVAGWPEQLVDPVVVTCGNEFTVTCIVSVLKQVPVPNEYVNTNVPTVDGVNMPADVTFAPLHVPPEGVKPVNVSDGAFWQTEKPVPALATWGFTTETKMVSRLLHPVAAIVYV